MLSDLQLVLSIEIIHSQRRDSCVCFIHAPWIPAEASQAGSNKSAGSRASGHGISSRYLRELCQKGFPDLFPYQAPLTVLVDAREPVGQQPEEKRRIDPKPLNPRDYKNPCLL